MKTKIRTVKTESNLHLIKYDFKSTTQWVSLNIQKFHPGLKKFPSRRFNRKLQAFVVSFGLGKTGCR